MGLRDRIARALPGGGTPTLDALDLTTRISRPVAYTAGNTNSRLMADLEAQQVDGFAGSATAYACVQAIATNAAALDLVVERRTRAGVIEPVPDHPVSVLWNRAPNPITSARAFKEVLWSQLELLGEAFVYLDRGDTAVGPITAMYPIFDPVEVVVDAAVAGTLQGFRVRVGGKKVPLLPAEVLWLRYPHPRQAWGALAPYKAAQFALDLDGTAKAWQQGELRNGARPEGVVYLGDVDPDTHDAIVSDFRARHEGPRNANRHLFLSGVQRGAYDRIGLTAQEVAYRDTRDMNREEVLEAFRVPRDYLSGGTTYENRTAARATLWTDAIVPKLEVVAGEVDRQLLPDLFESCRFDTSQVDALRENTDAVFARAVRAAASDLATINEARAQIGLDPLPDEVGNLTLTAYRSLFARAGAQTPGGTDTRADAARASLRRVAALPGHSRAAVLDPDDVQRTYDRVEAIGVRAVRRLSERMERAVLNAAGLSDERAGNPSRAGRALLDALTGYGVAADDMTRTNMGGLVRAAADDVFDVRFWTDATREALGDTVVAEAYTAGAAQIAAGLGIGLDVFDPQVIAAMRGRADVLAAQVVETTRAALDMALLDPGVEAGESIPNLRDRLTAVFTDLSDHRATVIARTETVGGFNAASHIGARASGVALSKKWLAAGDNRVRDTHRALDGVVMPMDDRFANGCLYPGDPAGPPDETIQCRCVLTYDVDGE